ncbi:hypothetical protein [Achromobacter anxifer]|uniref:hypothetical protein n=1 Tax=Achromobacter anxifer TaxID=1287737 RepID=UPI002157BFB6|nr:hypothetical protein [Achromobacter anxifer]
MKKALLTALSLVLLPAAAAVAAGSQAAIPEGPTTCNFGAWTNYLSKPAIEVRDAPSANARIVGKLPTVGAAGEPEYAYSITFDVIAAQNGWLKIANASDDYNEAEDESRAPRKFHKGEGWIRSGDARIGIQSGRGYLKPDPKSKRLLDLGSNWLTEMGTINGILACHQDWVLLDYTVERKRLPDEQLAELAKDERSTGRAWFRGLCSSQETSCDMKSVDQ